MQSTSTTAAATAPQAAPTTSAEQLASQFRVEELEPRLENSWSGGRDGTDLEHAEPTKR